MDILLCNIKKSFEGQPVLRNVSLVFPAGKITCLMGASGIGKTTLANILLGLTKPDSGTVEGITGKRISAVFQEDRLIEHWDAVKNIMLVYKSNKTEDTIRDNFTEIGLEDYEKKPVHALSGGMRRRVAIVRAVIAEHDLILMDEPFKGLDETSKNRVIDYLKKHTAGSTVIIITHDPEEVRMLGAGLITMG